MVNKHTSKKSVWFIYVILGIVAAIGVTMFILATSHPTWVGEQADTAGYFHKAFGLLSDMPHMTAELFYDAIENSIVFCIAFLIARSSFRREHERFDREHGITHEEDD